VFGGSLTYLIRYGAMGHIARFGAGPPSEGPFHRGQAVVIQSHRGMELGEVLIPIEDSRPANSFGGLEDPESDDSGRIETVGEPRVLRAAGSEDLARAKNADALQPARFARCQRILQEGGWPWELLDVEPLLDGHTTVLHYLGPRHIEDATMLAQFRIACEFDVVFEPVASELEGPESVELNEAHGCGSGCGSGGCGSGGGCGVAPSSGAEDSASSSATASGGSGHASHGGCESCGISRLMANRRR
jgi:PSP1 C-terminal conserved region